MTHADHFERTLWTWDSIRRHTPGTSGLVLSSDSSDYDVTPRATYVLAAIQQRRHELRQETARKLSLRHH
jgi:hypothetical protein